MIPVVRVYLVASLLTNTCRMAPHTLLQCFLSTLTPYDFSRGIMLVAGEVMALRVIVLFDSQGEEIYIGFVSTN